MNREELKLILQEGEGYKTEFKENTSGLDREIIAFANSSGGRILIGITDNSKVKGIVISNKLRSQIQDMANNCRPKVKIIMEEFEGILIINVREGDDKPYECSAGYFKRVGPNSQKMTRDEIIEFFKSEGKIRFDELTEPKFRYPKDFDREKLMKYLELGSGMRRMRDICKAENAPYPRIKFTDTHFYITFRPSREYLSLAEEKGLEADLGKELSERQKMALDYVKEHGRITNREYRELCDVGADTAHRDLLDLVNKGVLKREGSGRSVCYQMIIG